jgi:hypothetical protein
VFGDRDRAYEICRIGLLTTLLATGTEKECEDEDKENGSVSNRCPATIHEPIFPDFTITSEPMPHAGIM